jgi:hypothetical protein
MWRGSNWAAVVAGASALAIGVGACGGSSGSSSASSGGSSGGSSAPQTSTVTVQTKTVTAPASGHDQAGDGGAAAQQGKAGAAGGSGSSGSSGAGGSSGSSGAGGSSGSSGAGGARGAAGGSGAIAVYQPSSLVSKSAATTVLTSPDSVDKIGAFYGGVLANAGWQIRSSAKSAYSANFTAHRDGEGVSISVYPRGSGAGITISKHPE